MTFITLGLDVLLACLLAASIYYAMRLEKALTALRRDRATLEGSASGFGEALRVAQDAVGTLRAAAATSGREMGERLTRAETIGSKIELLAKDLPFIVERAETLADRLDGLVRVARPLAASSANAPAAVSATPSTPRHQAPSISSPDMAPRSQAERDLMQALRATK